MPACVDCSQSTRCKVNNCVAKSIIPVPQCACVDRHVPCDSSFSLQMASTSKKSVSFAKEKEEIGVESSESDSSDASDVPDYVESFSVPAAGPTPVQSKLNHP